MSGNREAEAAQASGQDSPVSGSRQNTRTPDPGLLDLVEEPVKVMRIGRMILQLLDEVRSAPLDDAARARLRQIHGRSVKELQDCLPHDLTEELRRLWVPPSVGSLASGEELRISQAQLAGWLEGLVWGIQTTVATRQVLTRQRVTQLPGMGFPVETVMIPGPPFRPESPAGREDRGAGVGGADTPGQYL